MLRNKWLILLVFISGSSTIMAQVLTSTRLPIVKIETNGQTIPDEPKIMARMQIIARTDGQPNHISDPPDAYDGFIGIELRGSTSQYYDKKPYSIETRKADGSDRVVSLLGMPSESDWALISPLNDKSLMRDVLAYHLGNATGDWAPRTRFVEVLLNGKYEGVYVLVEKIKRDKNRVNLAKLSPDDTTLPNISGGYLLAMDKQDGAAGGDWVSIYPPLPGSWQRTYFQVVYPKPGNYNPEQFNYIKNYISKFEDALAAWQPNIAGVPPVYEKWIDTDSWVNYLLVNELTKNTDAYRLSAFFSKDRDDRQPLIKMGPIWDFNIAFGLGDYCNSERTDGWAFRFNSVCPHDEWLIHFWWDKLLQDHAFQRKIIARWKHLRNTSWSDNRIHACIDSLAGLIAEAQVRNFQRWPVLGKYVWPNAYIGQTWQNEVNYLKNFVQARLAWIDAHIESLDLTSQGKFPQLAQTIIFPNPIHPGENLIFRYSAENQTQITFTMFDAAGRQMQRSTVLPPGNRIQFEWTVPDLAAGIYWYQIRTADVPVRVGKLVVVR